MQFGRLGWKRAASWASRISVVGAVMLACGIDRTAYAIEPTPDPEGVAGTFGNGSVPTVSGAAGAMEHGVPFELPAARGAAQPPLGLHYRSSGGAGEAGEGWSLGLPSIERTPLSGWPRYADPGNDEGAEDRLAFDGAPLTFICVVGGSPTCPGSAGTMPSWANGMRHYRLQVGGGDRFFLNPERTTFVSVR